MFDEFVQDQARLVQVCRRLRGEPRIALDTEFVRERTYYAQLCLIQIATSDRLICIDPLAFKDLGILLDVIYDQHILKVLHSARQDLEVFHDLRGTPPAPVFDTQIAAALVGHEDQIGYGALVEALHGVKLEKLHTRANWAARPLGQGQLDYAEDDVRHLRVLYERLAAQLAELGRGDWLIEECARLTAPHLYRNDPDHAYERIKKGRTLPPANQQMLRALASWRERTAQRRNLPRNWVLRDTALLELVQANPTCHKQLEDIKGVGAGTVRKWGNAILQAIADGRAAPPVPLWREPKRLTPAQVQLCHRMLTLVKKRAREQGISPALLATRKDIQALVHGDTKVTLLTGWRRQVVGEKLLAMLDDSPSQGSRQRSPP